MSVDIRVPVLGESVTEATIGQWFKKVGDTVAADEPVVELETDKVTIEVPAPSCRRARGDQRRAGRDGQCRRADRRDQGRRRRRQSPPLRPAAKAAEPRQACRGHHRAEARRQRQRRHAAEPRRPQADGRIRRQPSTSTAPASRGQVLKEDVTAAAIARPTAPAANDAAPAPAAEPAPGRRRPKPAAPAPAPRAPREPVAAR